MKCTGTAFKITGILHVTALIVTFVGMGFQFYSVANDQPYAIWLPLTLCIMMLMRIPNQICVAFKESHGWFSVIGSLFGLAGYIALTVLTFNKSKTVKNEHVPTPLLDVQKKFIVS